MALLFISHNLAVVRHLCDEVVVLHLGRVVERAPRRALRAPRHPYTRALLAAVPEPDPASRARALGPELAPPVRADGGLRVPARCPRGRRLLQRSPGLETSGLGAAVACHRWRDLPAVV